MQHTHLLQSLVLGREDELDDWHEQGGLAGVERVSGKRDGGRNSEPHHVPSIESLGDHRSQQLQLEVVCSLLESSPVVLEGELRRLVCCSLCDEGVCRGGRGGCHGGAAASDE